MSWDCITHINYKRPAWQGHGQSEKATHVCNKVHPLSTDHFLYSAALIVSI